MRYSPLGHKELDTTKWLNAAHTYSTAFLFTPQYVRDSDPYSILTQSCLI